MSKKKICPRCDGEGDVKGYEPGGFPAMFRCRECKGTGKLKPPEGGASRLRSGEIRGTGGK